MTVASPALEPLRGPDLRAPAPRRSLPVVVGVAVLALTACRTGSLGRPASSGAAPGAPASRPAASHAPGPQPDRPLDEGSARRRQQAQSLLAGVPGAPLAQRMETAQRITALGEPGVKVLVEALTNPDPRIREFAAWTLGYASDRRAVPALRDATSDPVLLVSLEAAAARVRLGDDGGLVRLVQGLEDADPRIRSKCLLILQNRTGRTYDFLPDDPPAERAAALERWRVFLKQRGLIP